MSDITRKYASAIVECLGGLQEPVEECIQGAVNEALEELALRVENQEYEQRSVGYSVDPVIWREDVVSAIREMKV